MVREDILGGLKSAISRGESLKQAMITFYNAGYKKEEIEWAAKTFQTQNPVVSHPQITRPPISTKKSFFKKRKIFPPQKNLSKQVVSKYPQSEKVQEIPKVSMQTVKNRQKISRYGKKPSEFEGKLIITLIGLLIILFAVLAGVFLLRTQIIDFFNKMF